MWRAPSFGLSYRPPASAALPLPSCWRVCLYARSESAATATGAGVRALSPSEPSNSGRSPRRIELKHK